MIPITPIGVDICLINKPLGLFHFSIILFVGSSNFLILCIDCCIPSIFTLSNFNLSIKFSGIFFFIAKKISFLFADRIFFLFFSINNKNFSKTLFLESLSTLICDALFALFPILINSFIT